MKSKSKSTQTNTYGWQTPPKTAAQEQYEKEIINAYDTPDPNIAYTFNKAEEQLKNSFNNPWGSEVSPEVQAATIRSGVGDLTVQRGLALREDAMNRKLAKVGAYQANAAMQAPQLTQTGGTVNSSQTQAIGPALFQLGGQLGSAALMA